MEQIIGHYYCRAECCEHVNFNINRSEDAQS
jgi:hypothetical protein